MAYLDQTTYRNGFSKIRIQNEMEIKINKNMITQIKQEKIKVERNKLFILLYKMLLYQKKIDDNDIKLLSLVPEIDKVIKENIDNDIYIEDWGKWTDTDMKLVIKLNETSVRSLISISSYENEIKDKIIELYPYSDEELKEIELQRSKKEEIKAKEKEKRLNKIKQKQKNIIYNIEDRVGFGKYKMYKWKNLSNKDENYIKWLIDQNEEGNFKNFLIELIKNKI